MDAMASGTTMTMAMMAAIANVAIMAIMVTMATHLGHGIGRGHGHPPWPRPWPWQCPSAVGYSSSKVLLGVGPRAMALHRASLSPESYLEGRDVGELYGSLPKDSKAAVLE